VSTSGLATEAPETTLGQQPRAARQLPGAAVIAGPALLAAVLCGYGITDRSLGFDEGATVAIASQHGSALAHAIARDGGNMSGYYLLVHGLIGVFGNGLLVLRLPSALAMVATVALIAAIGRRLFDNRVGLVAGLLAAVSLPLLYWAQTARGYAPMVAFVCAGFLALISLAEAAERDQTSAAGRRRRWAAGAAYAVAMTLAMYSSFVAVLVVPVQVVVLARRRAALRRLAWALAAVTVCSLPLAILAVRRGSGQLFWVPRPSRMVDTQALDSITSAGLQPSFHHTATTYLLLWATVAAVLGLAADLIRRRRRGQPAWARTVTLAWCIVPAALTFLYSLVSQPVFVPRNVLMSTPAVALALAVLIVDRRLPRWASAVLLVAVLAMRAEQVVPSYGVSPEPWQAVTEDVLARARPGDCIAFYPEDGRMAFQYYLGTGAAAVSRAPRSILPVLRWGAVKPFAEDYVVLSRPAIMRRAEGCRRMWFVSSHEGQLDGPPRSRANRAGYYLLDAELVSIFGWGEIEKYGYASTIHVQLLPGGRTAATAATAATSGRRAAAAVRAGG
jgi:mannosyltransferase